MGGVKAAAAVSVKASAINDRVFRISDSRLSTVERCQFSQDDFPDQGYYLLSFDSLPNNSAVETTEENCRNVI